LEGKLGSLRKLAFPATCKYTLHNSWNRHPMQGME
jgi:hypothetical protein